MDLHRWTARAHPTNLIWAVMSVCVATTQSPTCTAARVVAAASVGLFLMARLTTIWSSAFPQCLESGMTQENTCGPEGQLTPVCIWAHTLKPKGSISELSTAAITAISSQMGGGFSPLISWPGCIWNFLE